MPKYDIGVAVIGAGMAGRAHAAGYRSATTLYGPGLPDVRLVAVADVNEAFAVGHGPALRLRPRRDLLAGGRRGRRRRRRQRRRRQPPAPRGRRGPARRRQARAVREAVRPDRSPTPRRWSAAAAARPDLQTGVGFTFRRSPAIAAIKDLVDDGSVGRPVHFNGHYWCDYAVEPHGADELALQGRPGIGCPRRHRQPPRRPRRVPVRADRVRARHDVRDDDHRARAAARNGRRARGGRAERRPRTGRERGPA